ncbi:thiosulfate oxidation carrier complex protein SoxZ [Beggiatoa leptomitoformis]|uniref:Thiosulfate oxidation carrier complex protein SoxZ n=1 Tax=Beggiatoa leptomitoformis TaxID=288004 RepID=A0A2N9YH39_9GAMM|nr:thiosulfate oxidation carrier complex protein SoxZ [Beggiatoa leptomitoformis]ALG67912.1 thiosulfate oxidation carrier complex protein SoxZ [Beggiatoa leptomitoformis]AUI69817.1 thiosulfate oxidation carrier complex protein SoxZ [Beggiatoa leptomitoformis]
MSSIRVQAKLKEGVTEVKALISHPMETGSRKDRDTGELIPAHFIEELTCEHNGSVVMSAIWSAGISQNPYCAFNLKNIKEGDTIKLSWKDNLGKNDTAEVQVTV